MLDMKTLRIAAKNGQMPCLSYCYDYLRTRGPVDLVDTDWRKVIENCNFTCLPFLVEKGVPVSHFEYLARQINNATCLKYLHEKLNINCWGPITMSEAASAGKLKLVEQLHEHSCPWDESAIIAALRADEDDCFAYLIIQRGVPTSVAFTSIVPRLNCRLVLLCHKAEELHIKPKEESDKLEQQLQRLETKMTKHILVVKKSRIVVQPRWK